MGIRRSIVALLVAFTAIAASASAESKRVLLVGQGPDGHPPTTHEFMAGQRILAKLLASTPDLEVTIVQADEPWPEGPELIADADAIVLYVTQGARWVQAEPRRLDALAQFAARGGGLVGLHWAIGAKDPQYIEPFLKLLGGCHGGPDRKYQVLETLLAPADGSSPITRGVESLRVHDEFYYQLKFVRPAGSIRPVMQATIDGKQETVAWSWERPDGGRSFGFSGLHFHENWRYPTYQRLALQAVLWTLHAPIPEDGASLKISADDLTLPPAR